MQQALKNDHQNQNSIQNQGSRKILPGYEQRSAEREKQNIKNSAISSTSQDSIITPFLRHNDIDSLKEEYSRLWYEKLALETSVQRLISENTKKDEIIRQLKMQAIGSGGLRHTLQ